MPKLILENKDEAIRSGALVRIAEVFNKTIDELTFHAKFGKELKSSFVSNFRSNEFDKIDQDIRDVADKKILKELSQGLLIISTVGEYCDHMVRCYASKPGEVTYLLKL